PTIAVGVVEEHHDARHPGLLVGGKQASLHDEASPRLARGREGRLPALRRREPGRGTEHRRRALPRHALHDTVLQDRMVLREGVSPNWGSEQVEACYVP